MRYRNTFDGSSSEICRDRYPHSYLDCFISVLHQRILGQIGLNLCLMTACHLRPSVHHQACYWRTMRTLDIAMTQCNTVVSPEGLQWRNCSLTLSCRFIVRLDVIIRPFLTSTNWCDITQLICLPWIHIPHIRLKTMKYSHRNIHHWNFRL